MKLPKILIIAAITMGSTGVAFQSLSDTTQTKPKVTVTQQQLNDQSTLAINWMQSSGEYAALTHQAFNVARMSFDIAVVKGVKNPAVVVDIDETVFNNSYYQAEMIGTDKQFSSASWNEWVKAKQATAIPGAVSFVNYVNSHGGKVFYISNRDVSSTRDSKNNDVELATIANLKAVGFTRVNESTTILDGEFVKTINGQRDTSKQWRREAVEKGLVDGIPHTIVVLIGDNLDDFDARAGKPNSERRDYVETNQRRYGTINYAGSKIEPAYIVIPNPMYGSWEAGLYKPSEFGSKKWFQMSPSEKNQQRKEALMRSNY